MDCASAPAPAGVSSTYILATERPVAEDLLLFEQISSTHGMVLSECVPRGVRGASHAINSGFLACFSNHAMHQVASKGTTVSREEHAAQVRMCWTRTILLAVLREGTCVFGPEGTSRSRAPIPSTLKEPLSRSRFPICK